MDFSFSLESAAVVGLLSVFHFHFSVANESERRISVKGKLAAPNKISRRDWKKNLIRPLYEMEALSFH